MPEPLQNEEPTQLPHSAPAKRPPGDDEIQFISSNPIKKRRLTEQEPVQMARGSMPPPPPPRRQTPSQATPVDRRRSLCDISQTKAPIPGSIPESRGASLPVLEGFASPQSFPVPAGQSSRLSEAISPKQLPRPFPIRPEIETNTNQGPPLPPATTPGPQHPVTLDQISCLDFNGVPTNTPGFDMSRIFSSDGGILGALGMGMGTSAPPPAPMDAINPLGTDNATPFAMYPMGNPMTMPPNHGGDQIPAPSPSGPMQHHGVHSSGPVPSPLSRGQYLANPPHPHVQPQGGNMALNRSPPPAPGAKPPCLHCARIGQEKLWRQVQASPLPVGQQHSRYLPPPPVFVRRGPGPMPRPPPADEQPAPVQSQYHHQHQHQHQNHSDAQFLTPAVVPTPTTRPSLAGPALLHDIAQTIQVVFPYAQVADRHGMVSAKVAEMVSDMVIKPLMRGVGRPPGME